MNQGPHQIRDAPNAKLYILIGFCITAALLFLCLSSDNEPTTIRLESREMPELVRTGGLGEVLQQDDQVKEVVEKIKPILEEKSGIRFTSLEVIHYRPQIVAGKNYFVKAKAKPVEGEEQIVHLRIYQNLSRELELTAYQLGKGLEDELKYFQ